MIESTSRIEHTFPCSTTTSVMTVKNSDRFSLSTLQSQEGCLKPGYLERAWRAIVRFFQSLCSCFGLFSKKTTLSAQQREERICNDTHISTRLNRQLLRSREQLEQEPAKPFRYLEAPPSWDAHGEVVGGLEVGVSHIQGRRPTMEDEHLATHFQLNIAGRDYPIHLFGIFDGHGGVAAAEYVRDHLQEKLIETLLEFNSQGLSERGIWNALKMTSIRLNRDFKNQHHIDADRMGTTATIAMILDGNLWTANVGDARIVLVNGGNPVQCTEDAKPNNPRYKQGIENRGGHVTDVHGVPRVNGKLAVARAIGDHGLNGAISARPKITRQSLSVFAHGSQLILGCDGVWDVTRSIDGANAVHAHRNRPAAELARNLTYSAYQAGSTDNISAMVIKFEPHLRAAKESVTQ